MTHPKVHPSLKVTQVCSEVRWWLINIKGRQVRRTGEALGR